MARVNGSVLKALKILDLFDDKESWELTIAEIAKKTSISPGSVYPIVAALESSGYLRRTENGLVTLGYKILDRAHAILEKDDILSRAKPHVRRLAQQWKVNVHLGVLHGDKVLYLHREQGGELVVLGEIVGWQEEAYCTALGKCLLASLSDTELRAYLSRVNIRPITSYTITDKMCLYDNILSIRQAGFAISNEESHDGIIGVAAPISSLAGHMKAAISVSVPKSRFKEKGNNLITAVRDTALRITKPTACVGTEVADTNAALKV